MFDGFESIEVKVRFLQNSASNLLEKEESTGTRKGIWDRRRRKEFGTERERSNLKKDFGICSERREVKDSELKFKQALHHIISTNHIKSRT